jgi:hypothetical protein
MNTHSNVLARVLIFAGIATVSGHAGAQTIPEYDFSVTLNVGLKTGMKVGSAADNSTIEEYPTVRLIGVPALPAEATDVEVMLVYRDASGVLRETGTGLFGAGCSVERTDDGVDVMCPLVSETP